MTTFYAVLDANDLPVAFYSDDLFPPNQDGSLNAAIPGGAIQIDADAHQDCILNQGLRKIVGGAVIAYTPPPPAQAVPQTITRGQFITQAAADGDITSAEALAWMGGGTLPSVIANTIARLPQAQQLPAQIALLAAEFQRDSQWTAALATILNKTDAQVDAMWIAASALPC